MRKRRKGRIYVKDPTNGRLYGDFRDLNGKCEALKQDGRATTDWDVAGILVAKRVKELEEQKRGMGIVGRGREETLNDYALHHLKKKKASKGERKQLDRAVEFFGPKKTQGLVHVDQELGTEIWVKTWAEIIHSAKARLSFFQKGLEYEASDESALAYLRRVHREQLPEEVDKLASPRVKIRAAS